MPWINHTVTIYPPWVSDIYSWPIPFATGPFRRGWARRASVGGMTENQPHKTSMHSWTAQGLATIRH